MTLLFHGYVTDIQGYNASFTGLSEKADEVFGAENVRGVHAISFQNRDGHNLTAVKIDLTEEPTRVQRETVCFTMGVPVQIRGEVEERRADIILNYPGARP